MRKANLVQTAIWDDEAFTSLGPDAQLVYLFLITQPTVMTTGLLPMRRRWWGQRLFAGDQDRLDAALDTLIETMFVWVDETTEELLIRSWVKHNVQGKPNMEKGARDVLPAINSTPLRIRLVDENPTVFDPSMKPSRNGIETVPEVFSEKVREHVSSGKRAVTSSLVETERARARNEQWDALAEIFGYTPASKSDQHHWGKLTRELAAMNATHDTIHEASRRYHIDMPNVTHTPAALVKHYQRLMSPSWRPRNTAATGAAAVALQLAAESHEQDAR